MELSTAPLPKVVWILWLQGWDMAPPVAKASLASWQLRNPGWQVRAICLSDLNQHIAEENLADIMQSDKPPEALSDQIRFELLSRHGGVWADATTICANPLDIWIHQKLTNGFFAFANPGPDRMLSTWFLAAKPDSYIINEWRRSSVDYWVGRSERDDYFWPHNLFKKIYNSDTEFKAAWDKTPKISAAHPLHFGPHDPALTSPISDYYVDLLRNPPAPVFKLTHKTSSPVCPNSLMEIICQFGQSRDILWNY